jgi:hypothetical protein
MEGRIMSTLAAEDEKLHATSFALLKRTLEHAE